MFNFIQDESGASALEYGLLGSLVALAIIGSIMVMGDLLESVFASIVATISVG